MVKFSRNWSYNFQLNKVKVMQNALEQFTRFYLLLVSSDVTAFCPLFWGLYTTLDVTWRFG